MLGSELTGFLGRSGIAVVSVDISEIDIRLKESVEGVLGKHSPGVVFNAAALADVDGCERAEDEAFAVNAQGPENLARVCSRIGAFLVHVSTDYVFDGRTDKPYREEDEMNPLGVYGKSKALGEKAVRAVLPQAHCIIRTQWLFGRQGRNFVEAVIERGRDTGALRVVNDQFGSPTYTADLAKAMVRLAHSGASGTFHVTNSGATSWHGFAGKIMELCGLWGVRVEPIKTRELDRPAPRPGYSVLDNAKYVSRVGQPLRRWESALKEYVRRRSR
jgi:dTDP-4-dehydrorhamnose reductase